MSRLFLLVRETRAGETRVALTPDAVRRLHSSGIAMAFESGAGVCAGFSDDDFEAAGAQRRDTVADDDVEAMRALFEGVHTVVRVKRASAVRERAEIAAFGQIATVRRMVGALDTLERGSSHVQAWQALGIDVVSLDQMPDVGLLRAMSELTGALCLRDAVRRCAPARPVCIALIGFGVSGRSALLAALQHDSVERVVVLGRRASDVQDDRRVHFVAAEPEAPLTEQQRVVRDLVIDADIVVASARRSNTPAPLLIPTATLLAMKPGAVVVDLALTEGGNVEGAQHDQTLTVGSVQVCNVSGYPKAQPNKASQLWSDATLRFFAKTH